MANTFLLAQGKAVGKSLAEHDMVEEAKRVLAIAEERGVSKERAGAMLAAGIGDPRRVGIVGASFGGYSTLLGLSYQPELFRVGIASVPPSDFGFVMREYLGANLVRLAPARELLADLLVPGYRHLRVAHRTGKVPGV